MSYFSTLNWEGLKCISGLLCAIIGILVVILNCMMPEQMKEAFSFGADSTEDEDISCGEGHMSSAFLDGVTVSPLRSKARAVSWRTVYVLLLVNVFNAYFY